MSIIERIITDSKGDIIVQMRGGLDYDNTIHLREQLKHISEKNRTSVLTLNLERLNFIGSSGISHFVETLNILSETRKNLKLEGVSEEFVKVFKLYELKSLNDILDDFESDETEFSARFAGRSKTYQN